MVQLPPPAAGFDDASAASTSAFADAAASASFAASAPAAQPRPSPPSSSGAGSGSGSVSVSAGSSAGVRVPAGARPGAPDSYYPFAYKVHEGGRVGELRGVVASLLGLGAGRIPRKLPGPLPHTMSRAAIPTIARGYWVCEKTDGLRTMLLAHPALGVFLIDRSFDFYQIDDDRGLFAAVLATRGPSLLDCELVRNVMGAPPGTELLAARQSGPFVLAVFDVVCLNGDDTAQLLLVDRLQRAGLARNAMNEALGRAQLASSDAKLPFVLTTKLFKPAYDMKSLQRMMVEFRVHGDKHYCFDNAEKGIKTLNDGLIFTPNDNNYAMTRTSLPIYKWKWPGMNTVDFLLRKPWFDNKGTHRHSLGNRVCVFNFIGRRYIMMLEAHIVPPCFFSCQLFLRRPGDDHGRVGAVRAALAPDHGARDDDAARRARALSQ